jgi:hypothetical protein
MHLTVGQKGTAKSKANAKRKALEMLEEDWDYVSGLNDSLSVRVSLKCPFPA